MINNVVANLDNGRIVSADYYIDATSYSIYVIDVHVNNGDEMIKYTHEVQREILHKENILYENVVNYNWFYCDYDGMTFFHNHDVNGPVYLDSSIEYLPQFMKDSIMERQVLYHGFSMLQLSQAHKDLLRSMVNVKEVNENAYNPQSLVECSGFDIDTAIALADELHQMGALIRGVYANQNVIYGIKSATLDMFGYTGVK